MPNFKPTFYCQNCGKQNDWKGHSYENKYCNNACQQEAQRKKKAENWIAEGTFVSNASPTIACNAALDSSNMRSFSASAIPEWIKGETGYIAQTRGYNCAVCSISDWRGQKLKLEPDHADGDTKNVAETNIRLLCPNCKSLLPSYKSRKKST